MASFAPVCPVHIYKEFLKRDILGNYHLLLAHDILENAQAYAEVFDQVTAEDRVVILDNSIIELGTAVDIHVIAQAAVNVNANVIVLPDVLLDADATVKSCRESIGVWARALDNILGEGEYTFMIAPQGQTVEDFARCAEAFADDERIGWWGIPRNYVASVGSRDSAVHLCHMIDNSKRIHLLGFSDHIADDMLCARCSLVDGIDSAVPIRAASLNMHMSMDMRQLPSRGDWWKEAAFKELMVENLATARKWTKFEL